MKDGAAVRAAALQTGDRAMSRSAHIGLASLLAGPSFVLTAALATLYLQLPAPITVTSEAVIGTLAMACIAVVFGAFVALPVNAVGASAMLALGSVYPPARTRIAWALVGCGIGVVGAGLFNSGPQCGFALAATSALCGWVCSFDDGGSLGD